MARQAEVMREELMLLIYKIKEQRQLKLHLEAILHLWQQLTAPFLALEPELLRQQVHPLPQTQVPLSLEM
jgi:hypothetical protein